MRIALTALTDELKRLRSTGVTSVSVSDESIATLRRVITAQAPSVGGQKPTAGKIESVVIAATPVKSVANPAALIVPKLPSPPVVIVPPGDKASQWAWLRDQVLNHPICVSNVRPGKKVVLGVGSLDAKIMFVGEAPEAEDEVRGEPFTGPAGELLTKMIGGMGLKRDDVYIASIMNWRLQMPVSTRGESVGHRHPSTEEMAFCLPFLRAQIAIINPELIVVLGSTAAQGLLGAGSFKTLGDIRGKWSQFMIKPLMVTYHPSYLLRPPIDNRKKRLVWEDLLKVMEHAKLPISDKQRGYYLDK